MDVKPNVSCRGSNSATSDHSGQAWQRTWCRRRRWLYHWLSSPHPHYTNTHDFFIWVKTTKWLSYLPAHITQNHTSKKQNKNNKKTHKKVRDKPNYDLVNTFIVYFARWAQGPSRKRIWKRCTVSENIFLPEVTRQIVMQKRRFSPCINFPSRGK